jgi:hypothetical protein
MVTQMSLPARRAACAGSRVGPTCAPPRRGLQVRGFVQTGGVSVCGGEFVEGVKRKDFAKLLKKWEIEDGQICRSFCISCVILEHSKNRENIRGDWGRFGGTAVTGERSEGMTGQLMQWRAKWTALSTAGLGAFGHLSGAGDGWTDDDKGKSGAEETCSKEAEP